MITISTDDIGPERSKELSAEATSPPQSTRRELVVIPGKREHLSAFTTEVDLDRGAEARVPQRCFPSRRQQAGKGLLGIAQIDKAVGALMAIAKNSAANRRFVDAMAKFATASLLRNAALSVAAHL